MPTSRPAAFVTSALRLGAALGVEVVVLSSGKSVPSDVLALAGRVAGCQCTVIPVSGRPGLPRLETAHFTRAPITWHGDLPVKRNLGLLLGRLCGWRTVLFLDDDIRAAPALVERAVGALSRHAAVGMPATDFPDNSVVGHARRLAFADQGVFVSGSALAVDLDRVRGFFPEVYNEDWLFLAPALERREVGVLGTVRQILRDDHDPYADPTRAAEEEFGDVVGEGLLGQLHVGPLGRSLSRSFWSEFLDRRADLLAAIAVQLGDDAAAARALAALDVVGRVRLHPTTLAAYVAAWQADLEHWRRHLAGITPRSDLRSAAAELGLSAESVGIAYPARRTGSG